MSQALNILLSRYNNELSNVPLGILIKAKAPEKTSQLAVYGLAALVGVFGLFMLIIGLTRTSMVIMAVGLLIAANVWKRSQSSNVRKVFSVLIGAEDVTLSQGFRTHRIPRDEVADISIRQRSSDGQQEAQLFFTDAAGRQYESLTFYGMSGKGLKESADRIADHIWNYVKTEEYHRKDLEHLDPPITLKEDEDDRAPWG